MKPLLTIPLFVTSVLFVVSTLIQKPPQTVGQVLGRDKVSKIINEGIEKTQREFSQTFVLTEQSVNALRANNFPAFELELLGSLKDKEYKGEKEFRKILVNVIGNEQATKFGDALLLNTRGSLEVKDTLRKMVEREILNTEAPDSGVEKWTSLGFQQFLREYIALYQRNAPVKNRLSLGEDKWGQFLQKAHCGVTPCPVPPCCHKRDVKNYCRRKCN